MKITFLRALPGGAGVISKTDEMQQPRMNNEVHWALGAQSIGRTALVAIPHAFPALRINRM
jgi:hypothetical protein